MEITPPLYLALDSRTVPRGGFAAAQDDTDGMVEVGASGQVLRTLVTAGVILRGNQHQARASGRSRFRLDRASERRQDAKDRDIRGKNSETNRGDYGKAENERHKQRVHGQPNLSDVAFIRCTVQKSVYLRFFVCGGANLQSNPR
jgi:hypothetical protein